MSVPPSIPDPTQHVQLQTGGVADPWRQPENAATPAHPAPFGKRPGSNGVATAGVVLSIVPLLGLLISLIALVRSRAMGGTGRRTAAWGIALSIVIGGAYGVVGYSVVGSATSDPACAPAVATYKSFTTTLLNDITTVASASASGQTSQITAANNRMLSDIQAATTPLGDAAGKATNSSVRTEIQALNGNLEQLEDVTKQAEGMKPGPQAQALANSSESIGVRLGQDGATIEKLCGDSITG